MNKKYKEIPVELIDENPDNEQIFGYEDVDYLAESIKENGFGGAIEVYELANGRYEISSGHRRYLAAKALGYETISCIIKDDTDDITKAKTMILRNIHSRNMTALKLAKCINYYDKHVLLKEGNYSGKRRNELAKIFNLSPTSVQRYMSLLHLIPEFEKLADQKNFSYNNLTPLTSLSEDDQKEVYRLLRNIVGDDNLNTITLGMVNQAISRMKIEKSRKESQQLKNSVEQTLNKEYGFKEERGIIKNPEEIPNNPENEITNVYNNQNRDVITDIKQESNDFYVSQSSTIEDDYIYDNTTDNVIIEDNTYLDNQFKNLIGEVKLLLASGMKFSSEMRNKEAEQEVQSILNEIKMMK